MRAWRRHDLRGSRPLAASGPFPADGRLHGPQPCPHHMVWKAALIASVRRCLRTCPRLHRHHRVPRRLPAVTPRVHLCDIVNCPYLARVWRLSCQRHWEGGRMGRMWYQRPSQSLPLTCPPLAPALPLPQLPLIDRHLLNQELVGPVKEAGQWSPRHEQGPATQTTLTWRGLACLPSLTTTTHCHEIVGMMLWSFRVVVCWCGTAANPAHCTATWIWYTTRPQ